MADKNSVGLTDRVNVAEQVGVSDSPRLEMLKQMLEIQRQGSTSADNAKRSRRRRALEQRAFALLQERNREFAAACGACPCFGASRRCNNCAGQGRPGWQAPDEELFLKYIGPALERLGILGTDEVQNQTPSYTTPADAGNVHPGEEK